MQDTTSWATKPRQRERVLVLVGYGFTGPYVEVFGESHIHAHIATVPFVGTISGERLADDVVDLQLPLPYRELNLPGKLRAQSVVRRTKRSELMDVDHYVHNLRALDALKKALSDGDGQEVVVWTT